MSFSGTPLGQGRRLDHHTFLNKPHPNNRPPNSPPPSSYAYGAPTLGSRSPPKPSSPTRNPSAPGDTPDESALARFARIKQREQIRPGTSVGTGIITSPPNPEKWSVKNTSVNIATAFHQAAYDEMQPTNPNNSWASGSRPNTNVPRSTSVEYEKETQSTSSRRLAVPPNRLPVPRSTGSQLRPLSKNHSSMRLVPDSEGEEPQEEPNRGDSGRAKSPFEQVVELTKRALAPATFYLRQRSQEPEELSVNGKEASYDYSAEEREYQAAQTSSKRPVHATHKRNRMSVDNKAYRPTFSDTDSDDDDDVDDGGKKGRRKKSKKKAPAGGPLTTLPVAGYDKRKKKKSRGTKGNAGGVDEDEQDESGSDEHSSEQRSAAQRASLHRGSAPPPQRTSVSRSSLPPQPPNEPDISGPTDESIDVERGLDSIAELDETEAPPVVDGYKHPKSTPFSIGGFLGKIVNWTFRFIAGILSFIVWILSAVAFLLGSILGTTFEVAFHRPARWFTHANPGPLMHIGKYLFVAFSMYAAWYALRDPLRQWIPQTGPSNPVYQAPEVPAGNIAELSARLQSIENVLSSLSLDHELSRSKQVKSQGDLASRLSAVETKLHKESLRVTEAERFKLSASMGIQTVRQEMEVLQAQLATQSHSPTTEPKEASDEEARLRLKTLEERVDGVEGGVKDALEMGKKSVKAGGVGSSAGAAWWNKLASGGASKAGLTIKSTDGQDVVSLIGHLVDAAVSQYAKDDIARPDLAYYGGGGLIIPSLTSPTYEIGPSGFYGRFWGLLTNSGSALGRPPVTALSHELRNGHCWPFEGTEGHLGVVLAAPAYISDVTIDHAAKDVAFDMRSAPREMEVWALVEGQDNIKKVKGWQAEKSRRREEAQRQAEAEGVEDLEPEYPRILPKSPQYLRIANFTYDIHAPRNIQTFPVSQEIRDLGVDFGLVVLIVKNNWGQDRFTCLYRFRVHGERLGDIPLPYPEDPAE